MPKIDWYSNYLANRSNTPQFTPQQADPMQRVMQRPTQQDNTPVSPTKARLQAKLDAASSNCPECGSSDYYAAGKGVGPGGSFDAYRCWECGYPAIQSGSAHGALAGAVIQGDARQAMGTQGGQWAPSTNPDSGFIVGRG